MLFLRRLLWPFSLLFGLGVRVKNLFYERKIFTSRSFPLPVISVGNLTTGGTGKTPHVEYLIRLLKNRYHVATISRGYGRKTKGFHLVENGASTITAGDEPVQYKSKFPSITVCVSEDRASGIDKLLDINPKPEVIIMDDAFQHRQVKAGFNILLIDYDDVFKKDFLLPAGNLREPISSAQRADVIIISKSPAILVPIERKRVLEHFNFPEHIPVFFSYLKYGEFNKVFGRQSAMLMGAEYYMEKRFTILLVTGIANPSRLIEYMRRHTDKFETLAFPDHHEFTDKDIARIQETFNNIANPSKIIVTTEKDAMRLRNPDIDPAIKKLPVFFLPIEVAFHGEENKFNELIEQYVRQNKSYN